MLCPEGTAAVVHKTSNVHPRTSVQICTFIIKLYRFVSNLGRKNQFKHLNDWETFLSL